MSTAPVTPFTLGVYVGSPDNTSVAAEAQFEANYSGFTTLMGAAPKFLTNFIDYNKPVSAWIGNAQWSAASAAQSPDAKSLTPVIALPMASLVAGSAAPDQQYQAFASGQYDTTLQGIVKGWAQQGFTSMMFRPGWEMNLQGPSYAGSTAQSQADWVSAFQHIYTVLHQAAAADGVNVQVVWNPGATNYSNAEATTNLYPGSQYVDAIGADVYSDIYPYSDSSPTPSYHDWDTGLEDGTVAQFIADPINRAHYWSQPAATKWSSDSSSGHSQSLASLITFAEQNGKPFVIPETGAGNSNAATGVNDDPAFPQWLAQQLTAAQAAGETIGFVNLWDSNGGGNYEFSNASDNKPLESAAWAKYFGAQAPVPRSPVQPNSVALTPVAPAAMTLGSGPDTLALAISEDAWKGDAQFTVSIDGVQIGSTQTTTASHSSGSSQLFSINGNFHSGNYTVTINFLNDAWGGTADTDRNLYETGATLDGGLVSGSVLTLDSGGPQSFWFSGGTLASSDTLDLHVSEDAWQGDAQFTVMIDGAVVGGIRTATASHGAGATQDVAISGNWGAGAHTVGVTFVNDAWGGTAATDRNLYIDQMTYDGQAASRAPATLLSNGTASFGIAAFPTVQVPASNTALTLHLAEDAWQGDAQYSVSVDGTTLVQDGTVTASNALGQSQAVNLQAVLAAGTHDVAISFLNDAWGGKTGADRNLYVTGIDVNATRGSGTVAALWNTGTTHFEISVPSS